MTTFTDRHHRFEMRHQRYQFQPNMSAITDIRTGATAPRTVTTSRHNVGFWIVGYAFAVTMAFSALPAPLYVLYQARDHFSTFMVTVIFAAYAAGVVASLFLAGHLSDWVGRRD